jgi:hypothetical protein
MRLMQAICKHVYCGMHMSKKLQFSTNHDRKGSNQSKTAQNLRHGSVYQGQVILQSNYTQIRRSKITHEPSYGVFFILQVHYI